MKDSFDQFRKNLENRPEPAFRDGDWKDLETRLDQHGSKGVGFAWWWVALPLFALLLSSNIYFLNQLKNANKNYTKVEIQTDTVYQTRVIYTTDTIFQSHVIHETSVEYINNPSFSYYSKYLTQVANSRSIGNNEGIAGILYSDDFNTVPLWNSSVVLSKYAKLKQDNELNETDPEERYAILNREIDFLDSKPSGFLSDPPYPLLKLEEPVITEKRRTLVQQAYMMRPKSASLGLNGGSVFTLAKGIQSKGGYSVGIEGNIIFSKNLRMWVEASFVRSKFDSERMDEALGVPIVENPADNYKFEKAEVPQPTLQYSAGLQYLFNTNTKWKPMLGLGYGAVSTLSYELLYEFHNEIDNLDWSFDQHVERMDLRADFLFLRAGLERKLDNHWNWNILGTYRTQFDNSKSKQLQTLGFQTGLSYRF